APGAWRSGASAASWGRIAKRARVGTRRRARSSTSTPSASPSSKSARSYASASTASRGRRRTPTSRDVQVLWAPWRMAYVADKAARGCIFCIALEGDRRERLLLGTTAASLVILNRFPYQNGHLMVAPRRHTASLTALPEAEHRDLAETLRRSIDTVAATFHPDGFNLGMNLGADAGAGVVD